MVKVIGIFTLTLCSTAIGQDSSSSFFESNYANKIFDESNAPSTAAANDTKQLDQPQSTPSKKIHADTNLPESKFVGAEEVGLNEPSGEPVDWIGLITTSNQGALTKNAFSRLQSIVRKYDFRVGDIVTIGIEQFEPFDTSIATELGLRGANFGFRATPPENLPIKHTPAWIIGTKKGEIILEGLLDPTLFFNSKGEYLGDPNEEPQNLDKLLAEQKNMATTTAEQSEGSQAINAAVSGISKGQVSEMPSPSTENQPKK